MVGKETYRQLFGRVHNDQQHRHWQAFGRLVVQFRLQMKHSLTTAIVSQHIYKSCQKSSTFSISIVLFAVIVSTFIAFIRFIFYMYSLHIVLCHFVTVPCATVMWKLKRYLLTYLLTRWFFTPFLVTAVLARNAIPKPARISSTYLSFDGFWSVI